MIDFDKIKIKKFLGSGCKGIVFLIKYENVKYALKIQKIEEKEIEEKNLNYSIWRECDLYEYIKNLNDQDQSFFMKLYDYKIFNCNKQYIKDDYKINKSLKYKLSFGYCIKMIIEYKGKVNLDTFLRKKRLKTKRVYSFCLQICKIIYILYLGGYSHTDLHLNNILINKTNLDNFNLFNKDISYQGYQLTAIDYGNTITIKNFFISKKYDIFFNNREYWMFNEIFKSTSRIIFGVNLNNIIKKKIIRLIIKNHKDFFNKIKNKYIKIFPKGKKILEFFIINIDSIEDNIFYKEMYLEEIIDRIIIEFKISYSKLYLEYTDMAQNFENILPNKILYEILLINNYEDFINYFINKC
jgi:serine/threonine protein kinase